MNILDFFRGKPQPPPILLVPLGTANLIAKHLQVPWSEPRDAGQIIDALKHRKLKSIDACRCNGRLFLAVAGVGFDAQVVHNLHRSRSGPITKQSYVMPTVATLRDYGFPHVRVAVDGVTAADSARPCILFETGLPPRYYLPLSDIRTDLLRPSGTRTHCPYKGSAEYWDVVLPDGSVHENIVWGYRTPLPESQKVAGLLAFYDEKVDVYLDGEQQPRPRTHFS